MNKEEIIKSEIASWINANAYYRGYFKKRHVKELVMLCSIATMNHPSGEKLITDFITGLALYPICINTKNEKYWVEFESLTKPVMDLIKKQVKTRGYQKLLIDKEISGEVVLMINEVKLPISKKGISKQIERNKATPIIPKDIQKVEKDFIECQRERYAFLNNPIQQTETKVDKLKYELVKYGFFDLRMIKSLESENQDKLLELIVSGSLAYRIAMFDFLGFISHLLKHYFKTKYKLCREISVWFNSDKDGRGVRGNINSLNKNSSDRNERYTSYLHKEEVEKDYQRLK